VSDIFSNTNSNLCFKRAVRHSDEVVSTLHLINQLDTILLENCPRSERETSVQRVHIHKTFTRCFKCAHTHTRKACVVIAGHSHFSFLACATKKAPHVELRCWHKIAKQAVSRTRIRPYSLHRRFPLPAHSSSLTSQPFGQVLQDVPCAQQSPTLQVMSGRHHPG